MAMKHGLSPAKEEHGLSVKTSVFWDITPYNIVETDWRFEGACCHRQVYHHRARSCEQGNEPLDSIKYGKFLYHPLELLKDSAREKLISAPIGPK
jgi:hypothetical protein